MLALLVAFSVFVASTSANSIKVLSTEGLSTNKDKLKSFISSKASKTFFTSTVIKNDDADYKLVNEVFNTQLTTDDGVKISAKDDQVILCPQLTNLNSDNYFGSKILDLCSLNSDSVCLIVSSKEVESDRSRLDKCCRRILRSFRTKNSESTSSKKKYLSILVDTSSAQDKYNSDEKEKTTTDLLNYIKKLGTDIKDDIEIKVVYANFSDKDSLVDAYNTITSQNKATESHTADVLASSLISKWNKISTEIPKPVYSDEEQQSLYIIESAFTMGLSQIEATISQWQKRVGQSGGKIIGKFSERVDTLIHSVLFTYRTRTAGTVTIRERNRRALELKDNIKLSVINLFNQQLTSLQTKISNSLKQNLLLLPEENKKEAELQVLRNALFEFKAAVADIEIEEFGLKLNAKLISDISTKFQTLASELPESPMAKLLEIRKMENQVKNPKKKGPRGFSLTPTFNIVGMLRPPGYGNLQGFINYATGLFGYPLEMLLGFQNDGDSPDIMGEDREYPLLRLQPKIHFDIDV